MQASRKPGQYRVVAADGASLAFPGAEQRTRVVAADAPFLALAGSKDLDRRRCHGAHQQGRAQRCPIVSLLLTLRSWPLPEVSTDAPILVSEDDVLIPKDE